MMRQVVENMLDVCLGLLPTSIPRSWKKCDSDLHGDVCPSMSTFPPQMGGSFAMWLHGLRISAPCRVSENQCCHAVAGIKLQPISPRRHPTFGQSRFVKPPRLNFLEPIKGACNHRKLSLGT